MADQPIGQVLSSYQAILVDESAELTCETTHRCFQTEMPTTPTLTLKQDRYSHQSCVHLTMMRVDELIQSLQSGPQKSMTTRWLCMCM